MATDAPLIVASWSGPPWAKACTTDEEAVIYSRILGRMADLQGGDMVVELVQRDELSVTATTVSITRQPPYLRMCGQRIPIEDTGRLAQILMTADDLVGQQSNVGQIAS